MFQTSLLNGPVPVLLGVLGAAGLLVLVAGRGDRWWRRGLPIAVAVTAVLTGAMVLLVDRVWRPFPDPLPPAVVAWTAVAVLGLVLPAARWQVGTTGTTGRTGAAAVPRGVAIGVAGALVLVAATSGANLYFGQYPTVGAALGVPLANQVDLTQVGTADSVISAPAGQALDQVWTPPADLASTGSIAEVAIPGTRSGFAARPGFVYLPPAYLATPRALLPVVVLLSGQPGSPRDWFDAGRLAERLDRYAAAHAGLAPVVVIPDHLGAPLANPLCMDSRLGRVGTYLDVDVPTWIRQNLQVNPDPRAWATGGYSEGGTCALQTALRAPGSYPSLLDISGQDGPTLGSRAATVRATFGGDDAAFRAVNPLDQLAARRYPDTAAMLVAGAGDLTYRPQADHVRQALLAAGVRTEYRELPGGHSWQVWGPAVDEALPWLGSRLGLTR